jgi:hypothetical protein
VTDPLAPDRWRRVVDLFQEATGVPPEGRAAFLASACGDDDGLRHEVETDGISRDIPARAGDR